MRQSLIFALLLVMFAGCSNNGSEDTSQFNMSVETAVQATIEARQVDEAASATLEARGPDPREVPAVPLSWSTLNISGGTKTICLPPEFQEIASEGTTFAGQTLQGEGIVIMGDLPAAGSNDFTDQVNWLNARIEDLRPDDPDFFTRDIEETGRLGIIGNPAYIVFTDESRFSDSATTVVLTFVDNIDAPQLLTLVRHPDTKMSNAMIETQVDILSQVASCYQAGDRR